MTTVYPRIAPNGSIIPNINNGGYTNYLDPFLEQEFKEEAYNIRRMLEHFSLAPHIIWMKFKWRNLGKLLMKLALM